MVTDSLSGFPLDGNQETTHMSNDKNEIVSK